MPTKSTTSTTHVTTRKAHCLYNTLSTDSNTRKALYNYIVDTLARTYTLTDKQIRNTQKYLDRYLDVIIEDLFIVYCNADLDVVYKEARHIMKSQYQVRWGQISISLKRPWASNILLPLLTVEVRRGFSGAAKLPSAVWFKLQQLLDCFHELAKNFTPAAQQVSATQTVSSYCNRSALLAYSNTLTNVREQFKCKQLIAQLDMHDMLVQGVSNKVSNREYLTGINLQNANKGLRSAALAGQWSYDINCAVFALFSSVAHTLTNTEQTVLLNYIKHRTLVRTSISQQTGLTVDQVKQVLTSVGFGAHSKRGSNIAVVMATPEGKEIIDAFRACRQIVLKYHPKPDDILLNTHLSNLYFKWETETMDNFIANTREVANARIHDNVIFFAPVSIKHTLSKMQLSFTTQLQYIQFTEEQL